MDELSIQDNEVVIQKKRGRPKGSKNKPKTLPIENTEVVFKGTE